MKTTFTKVATLALISSILLNSNAQANILNDAISSDNSFIADFNIENEINSNLKQMLLGFETEHLKRQIIKQISAQALELQTNQLVNDTDGQFPESNFKVIIAD